MPNPDDAFTVRKPRMEHPKGFQPSFKTGPNGYVVSHPIADRPDEGDDFQWLLEQWQLDPSKYRVEEPVEIRSWDQALGDGQVRTAYYVKAKLESRHSDEDDPDWDTWRKWLTGRKKPKKPPPTGDQALVVVASDWQLGKRDGWGMAGTETAIRNLGWQVLDHARQLRKVGVDIRTLALLCGGDLVEGCDGHYAQQTYTVQANMRTQKRKATGHIVNLLDLWAPHFEQILCAGVGGNHGEPRKNGKSYTDFADNWDVAAVEDAMDRMTFNDDGRYEHIRWLVPDDQLSITMDIEGTIVGLAHGHQAGGGKYPETKVWDWWRGQALGRRFVSDADVLCTAHFHTFVAKQDYGRWHLQCPTLDGGSRWFAENYGSESTAGTLTFVTSGGKVDHIRVLEGRGWT